MDNIYYIFNQSFQHFGWNPGISVGRARCLNPNVEKLPLYVQLFCGGEPKSTDLCIFELQFRSYTQGDSKYQAHVSNRVISLLG